MKLIEFLDLMYGICKGMFIGYALITMLRINAYIDKQESDEEE